MGNLLKYAIIGGAAYVGGKAAGSAVKASAKGFVPYAVVGIGAYIALKAWK